MFIKEIVSSLERNKDKIFYISLQDKITYGELLRRAQENAEFLKKQGVEPVLVYGHKSIDMVVSILSCLLAKRTYIPVDTCTPIERIEQIILQSKCSLFLKNATLDSDFSIETCTLKELAKFKDQEICLSSNTIAYIIFTSGSTGKPKGVPISYVNLENFIYWISNLSVFRDACDLRVLNQASFSFDLSVADFYLSLFKGFTLVALHKETQEDFHALFEILSKEHVQVIVSTPTFLRLCLVNPEFTQEYYPDLKVFYLCGECLDVSLAKKIFTLFPDIRLLNAYGPTEAISAVCASLITKDMLDEDLLPCGDVLHSATAISIVDDEIVLSGPSVFSGYLNDQKIEGVYYTGDIGYIRNHQLYCIGRKDHQIKYQGYRIEIEDIENNFKQIDGIEEAIVIPKRDKQHKIKFLKAFVLLHGKTLVEVEREVRKKLPPYMVPKQIEEISEIPTNCNGKVDRKAFIDDRYN